MAATFNLILTAFFLALTIQGSPLKPCRDGDVEINQKASGRTLYKHKTEFIVSISNKCACTVTNVELNCEGFETAVAIDPKLLLKAGHTCNVNNGGPVRGDEPVIISYFADDPFPFELSSFQFACNS